MFAAAFAQGIRKGLSQNLTKKVLGKAQKQYLRSFEASSLQGTVPNNAPRQAKQLQERNIAARTKQLWQVLISGHQSNKFQLHLAREHRLKETFWRFLGPLTRFTQNSGGYARWGSRFPIDEQKALYGLLGANFAVFLLWRSDPILCYKHFATSWEAVKNGRIHTLVTAAFSQRDFWHLFGNMFGLYFFGRSVAAILGGQGLILLYLACGTLGNVAHVLGQAWKASCSSRHDYYDRSYFRTNNSGTPTLGASGSVNGIIIFDCLYSPWTTVLLYGIVPVYAIFLGAGFIFFDIWGLMGRGNDRIAYSSHLVGAAVGGLAFVGVRRGKIPTQWRRW